MLSRVLMLRPAVANTVRRQNVICNQMMQMNHRFFRPGVVNPYREDPTPLSTSETAEQAGKPVWDRVFDHKKYMQHEGPLKVSDLIILIIKLNLSTAFYRHRFPRCWTFSKNETYEALLLVPARAQGHSRWLRIQVPLPRNDSIPHDSRRRDHVYQGHRGEDCQWTYWGTHPLGA